jgi:hypothetical protein
MIFSFTEFAHLQRCTLISSGLMEAEVYDFDDYSVGG